jgi:N2-acetyl-L-2,4-diaminobutanoate deacetylase
VTAPDAAPQHSPVASTLDYERDGVQHGFLRLPYSRDDSAWGAVTINSDVVLRGRSADDVVSSATRAAPQFRPRQAHFLTSSCQSSGVV